VSFNLYFAQRFRPGFSK